MQISSLLSASPLKINPPEPSGSNNSYLNTRESEKSDSSSTVGSKPVSEDESAEVAVSEHIELQNLKNRDREVRAHELAHVAVGGRYTSSAQFSYQKGSDGKLYATGGEVSIDTSTVAGDPKATLLKAQVIMRAALAPANPSAQDRNVAAQATAVMQQARADLAALVAEMSSVEAEDVGQNLDAFA